MYTSVAEEFERRNPKRGADSPPGGRGSTGERCGSGAMGRQSGTRSYGRGHVAEVGGLIDFQEYQGQLCFVD